jgi:hypothetical protein
MVVAPRVPTEPTPIGAAPIPRCHIGATPIPSWHRVMALRTPIVIPRPRQPIVMTRPQQPLYPHQPTCTPSIRLCTDIELPEWTTFKFSPKAWMRILEGEGVDGTAQQELLLLTQIDQLSAAKVIGEFMKTKADGRTLDNPSAWLHHNIKSENETKGYWA